MLNRWNFLKTGFYEGIKPGATDVMHVVLESWPSFWRVVPWIVLGPDVVIVGDRGMQSGNR